MNVQNINVPLILKDFMSIDLNLYEPKFIFNVDNQRYKVSRIVADIISPIVRNYHNTDESADEYRITTNLNKDKSNIDYFKNFLCFFTSIERHCNDFKSYKYYLAYLLQIGNRDKYLEIIDCIKKKLTTENVIDLFIDLLKADLYSDSIHSIIEFISSNFHIIKKRKLLQLQPEILNEIIADYHFPLKNDELLNYILTLYQKNPDYSLLFSNIDIYKVEKKKLIDFAYKINVNDLDQNTWISIWSNISNILEKSAMKNCLLLQFDDKVDFHGILSYLKYTKKTDINITSAPSLDGYDFAITNILIFDDIEKFYVSSEKSDGIICFDLGINSVELFHYSLMATNYLQSWTIEVSNDNKNWIIADEHTNSTVFNDSDFSVATFQISTKINFFSRYVRFHQKNSNPILISKFELYGWMEW